MTAKFENTNSIKFTSEIIDSKFSRKRRKFHRLQRLILRLRLKKFSGFRAYLCA